MSSLRSGFGTDSDSATRLRLDSDAASDDGLIDKEARLKKHVAKVVYDMNDILPKLRLVNELEGNAEKQGLYDLVSFYNTANSERVVVDSCPLIASLPY